MSKKVFFITGGGTGGHIYPAIAVADELIKNKDNEVYYVGNPDNMEYKIAQKKGYNFLPVKVSGMPRKFSFNILIWGLQLFLSIIQSYYYIIKYKPNMIFGTGGYVSAPVLFAAAIHKKTPYMLHDCDMQPGIVTRKFAPKAKVVSLAFEGAKKYIKNRNCYINGNPLRPEFSTLDKQTARESLGFKANKLLICVMGGSQGSKTIDHAFVEIIKELSNDYGIQIIFQTGEKNFDGVITRILQIYKDYSTDKNVLIQPYFEDMITVVKASDIVISRAGSLSLSEIFASEVAPILIPYPFAAADHQRKNAKYVQDHNACIYIEDSETDANLLLKIILDLFKNPEKVKLLKEKSSQLSKPDALQNIMELVDRVSKYND